VSYIHRPYFSTKLYPSISWYKTIADDNISTQSCCWSITS
jgi:hypothetical protein